MVARYGGHTFNPSTQEAKVRSIPGASGQPGLHSEALSQKKDRKKSKGRKGGQGCESALGCLPSMGEALGFDFMHYTHSHTQIHSYTHTDIHTESENTYTDTLRETHSHTY